MPLPLDATIRDALRAWFYAAAVDVGGFPAATHRQEVNSKPLSPQQAEDWASEQFSVEPYDLNGPRDGGEVTINGLYSWTLSVGSGDGDAAHGPLDAIKAEWATPGSAIPLGGGMFIRMRGGRGAYIDGPRHVGGWAAATLRMPWYVLARNSVRA